MRAALAIGLLALACCLPCASGCRDRERDDAAQPAESSEAPTVRRVVTLTPSATEIVAALGATELLVGVDGYSDYPPAVRTLPRVGDFLRPNFETIVALQPDLVIADAVHVEVAEGLEAAGVNTLTLPMHTRGDVYRGLDAVGQALGRADAASSARAAIDAELARVAQRAHQLGEGGERRPRVLAVVDRAPDDLGNLVAAGPGSYLDELLALVGADNALADYQVRYPKLSAEQLLRARPELIVDLSPSDNPAHTRRVWAALSEIPAVAAGRVYALDDAALSSPGPRIGAAALRLSEVVHGAEADPTTTEQKTASTPKKE
ncbi:ABC transporter substrate-binding protein [Haliangium ochraceum]|uniref:Periplasmic binding protein n=1 Tax=Haliangium ochraceum (strain DSM 14365 / JCM 11303 / SMP-2) TaxID=502025 RepID=D0LK26_HALO1|nr:helical backbone metal receptor [Haliangium ochraceum]ACY13060.1 periplasmic binding protein [Haliangium ochraceum DSM 14365]